MKRFSGPRNGANPSESFQQQLSMYVIAAGAAGVSALALAQPADAKIVYTKANVQISGNQHYNLDLNNDGITDFTLVDFFSECQCGFAVGALSEKPARGNAAIGKLVSKSVEASALRRGALISQGQLFYARNGSMAGFVRHCTAPSTGNCTTHGGGLWYKVTNRYLGLRFKIKGKIHYGWARLTVYVDDLGSSTLTGYAYETIAGKSIRAGQIKEAAYDPTNEDFGAGAFLTSPIPNQSQHATLGALAMGAPGLSIWRREQSVGAGR